MLIGTSWGFNCTLPILNHPLHSLIDYLLFSKFYYKENKNAVSYQVALYSTFLKYNPILLFFCIKSGLMQKGEILTEE
jgi:hypothetical protein